ncbi:hypothetical protein V8C42DRAFT_98226 [Trichoderma barbatum]
MGCNVLAIDASNVALSLMKNVSGSIGSHAAKIVVVDARKHKAEDVRRNIFGIADLGLEGGRGADAVLLLPEPQAAMDYGIELLKNHGTCVVVSFPKGGFHFEPRDLIFPHITLKGVLVGKNWQLQAMVNFAAQHGVRAILRTVHWRI